MKLRAILLILSISIAFTGCITEEADIFSASPIDRLNKAMSENAALLQSAENGWAMEYFATSQSRGYTLFAKFSKSGKVVFSSNSDLTNNVIASDSSVYDVIGDAGPVLTFNTYNKVLHAFSNPENPNGSGLEGDYEFVVISKSADLITLKGKKRGTTILMHRIPASVSWSQYMAETELVNSTLFANGAPALTMSLSDDYKFSGGGSHIFSILRFGAEPKTAESASFIVTRTGIRFHSVQNLDGKSFQTFTLNSQKSALICDEDPSLSFVGPDSLASYFATNSINEWVFNSSKMSSSVKATYDILVQSLTTKYKATNIQLSVKYDATRKTPVFKISFKENVTTKKQTLIGNIDFGFSATAKMAVTLTQKDTQDSNGAKFITSIVGYKEMADLIATSFTLTTETPINPQTLHFVKATDANVSFTLLSSVN